MQSVFLSVVMVLTLGLPAFADQKADVMKPVKQFIDGFNKGDTKAAIAACTNDMSILDDFPPHQWHGPGAMNKWLADYDVAAKTLGITEPHVKMGTPKHVDVTGDHAYVVAPTDYSYKMKDKPVSEKGCTLSVSLVKGKSG